MTTPPTPSLRDPFPPNHLAQGGRIRLQLCSWHICQFKVDGGEICGNGEYGPPQTKYCKLHKRAAKLKYGMEHRRKH